MISDKIAILIEMMPNKIYFCNNVKFFGQRFQYMYSVI